MGDVLKVQHPAGFLSSIISQNQTGKQKIKYSHWIAKVPSLRLVSSST